MMDRLCVKVHNDLKLLRNCPLESVQRDTRYAKEMVKDAKNSRALFPSLYELGHLLALDGPVRHKLDSVSLDVSQAVDKEVQMLLDSMFCLTRELCPLATRKAEANQKLCGVADRVTISRTFVRGVLVEEAGTAIHNKLNEVMLAVVTSLTNCIMDEILQELYQSHKKLARHILHLQRLAEQDSLTLELLRDKQSRNQEKEPEEATDDELSTSIDTLAIRRQTVHSRKIRPVSTFLSVSELELDRMTEDDSVSGRLSTSTTSSQQSHSLETLADLPTEGRKLEHQTRVRPRPRRNNRQPPTKLNNVPLVEKGEENGAGSKLDEGLENFYNWKVIPDSEGTPQADPQMPGAPASAPGPKKWKSRRRGGLFKFMRGRSAREESAPGQPGLRPGSRGSEAEVEAEDCPAPSMDRCYMKTSSSSSGSDRLEEPAWPSASLLLSKPPGRSRNLEMLEMEGTLETDRCREIPGRMHGYRKLPVRI
ncbi:capping protein, Arp2/3 and myosin-I linker protein 3-like, partial [Carcharodon carcharias]|uniref:capping protein, Arp2/3 and myosin-I linker protein 3-like n=1 Tax=Carcharodon carcharias TaxID=13397 RepID=UPI001B7E463D